MTHPIRFFARLSPVSPGIRGSFISLPTQFMAQVPAQVNPTPPYTVVNPVYGCPRATAVVRNGLPDFCDAYTRLKGVPPRPVQMVLVAPR